ncbi:MupG family TIM beta-alpha barrel fold protein [Cytobacillus gottheilii]|uniref:MupG family TIM beta-alpha barrel fold protein n=1 Tax=Cytobacillus gottheilii TaxID=859144 RepID=UPI0009BA89D1|nr:MupG family TIM beta-alpha barrel fold protein [Cytobacillus gottheilii]
MIGISFYLNDGKAEERIIEAGKLGVRKAFTSLHIPEESGNLADRAKKLLETAKQAGIEVYADVSKHTLKHLGISDFSDLKKLGVAGLRLDEFFDTDFVLRLAQEYKLALNASTVNERELSDLLESGLKAEQLIAWHNFYPKKETGLDENFFLKQNQLFQAYGIKISAFIPSIGEKRGPLFDGLPTLEKHRESNSLAAALELNDLGVDDVYIGDPDIGEGLLENLISLEVENIVPLQMEDSSFPAGVYTPRPDFARDVLRLMNTRTSEPIEPANTVARYAGSITADNTSYGRYNGEVSITLHDLPADNRMNVIGRISEKDLDVLKRIKPEHKIRLI